MNTARSQAYLQLDRMDEFQSENDDQAGETDAAVTGGDVDSPIPHRLRKETGRGVKHVLDRNTCNAEAAKRKSVSVMYYY